MTAATTPERQCMPGAGPRAASGTTATLGLVIALLVTGAGAVVTREALLAFGAISGAPWVSPALEAFARLSPQAWFVPAGAVAALAGLVLLVTALRTRPRRALALRSATGIHLEPRGVARLASDAARQVSGVVSASSVASRRKVVTVADVLAADQEIEQQIAAAVRRTLSPLRDAPRVNVKIRAPRSRTGKEA